MFKVGDEVTIKDVYVYGKDLNEADGTIFCITQNGDCIVGVVLDGSEYRCYRTPDTITYSRKAKIKKILNNEI